MADKKAARKQPTEKIQEAQKILEFPCLL